MPSDKYNAYQRWNVNQLMNDPHRTWRSWCRSIGYIARGSRALQDPRVGSRSSRDNVGNPVDYACTMLSYGAVKSLPLSPSLKDIECFAGEFIINEIKLSVKGRIHSSNFRNCLASFKVAALLSKFNTFKDHRVDPKRFSWTNQDLLDFYPVTRKSFVRDS
ncbi:hypothetical protein V1477_000919 [Vespula maculifrons]|uniref:Uncharacterized protein n=1 Tax=Vespula maculifrons TaxID=7453 RepID=A0ABD2D0D7_VESMC